MIMPVGVFEPDNPVCQNCWGLYEANCKEECETYQKGCTECLESFCVDGADSGVCDLETS